MRIDIVTVLPELLRSPFEASIMKRAIDKGLVEVHFNNLRDYTTNRQKSVDDYLDAPREERSMRETQIRKLSEILEYDLRLL